MKKSAILGSVISMAVCASLIAGSTYAIFGADTQQEFEVSSARLAVTSKVDGVETYSYTVGADGTIARQKTAANGSFASGGTVTLNADGTFTIDNASYGDCFSFSLTVENGSSIDIQYRLSLSANFEIAEAQPYQYCFFTVEEQLYSFYTTAWQPWAKEDGGTVTFTAFVYFGSAMSAAQQQVTVAFGDQNVTAGAPAAEKTFTVRVNVEALQGNAAGGELDSVPLRPEDLTGGTQA